eukprot:NODE_1043_length_2486_cov_0.484290.p1 type:complete len:227 gc:universal NODE_1043_length_2486_cov_0.484290:188-868(+)
MYSFAMLAMASVLTPDEQSKCLQSTKIRQPYYRFQTYVCNANAFSFDFRGLQAKYGLLESKVDEIRGKLESEDNLDLYEMAENLYKNHFNLNVVCVDKLYRDSTEKAANRFHLDKLQKYSRSNFNTLRAGLIEENLFNVWINLGKTMKNYPLGFVFDTASDSFDKETGTAYLKLGEYDVYYYKDMTPGTVLFFRSSEIVHGAVKISNEPVDRKTLEFRCMETLAET